MTCQVNLINYVKDFTLRPLFVSSVKCWWLDQESKVVIGEINHPISASQQTELTQLTGLSTILRILDGNDEKSRKTLKLEASKDLRILGHCSLKESHGVKAIIYHILKIRDLTHIIKTEIFAP